MPSVPLTIPSRPSVTSISPITSSSFEERRISQHTILPPSPTAPLIMSSPSSSSSMMRRSSSAPKPRRGSSLPSIPTSSSDSSSSGSLVSSNTSVDDTFLQREITPTGTNNLRGVPMDILQFISSTIEPSWEEVERSPLSLVPTILPISNKDNIDMITFLREAPGIIRSPLSIQSDSSSSFDCDDFLNVDLGNTSYENSVDIDGNLDIIDMDMEETSDVVTPELKPVSLRAFLEEDSSRFLNRHHHHQYSQEGPGDNSPNPSLYSGPGQKTKSSELTNGIDNLGLGLHGLQLIESKNDSSSEHKREREKTQNTNTSGNGVGVGTKVMKLARGAFKNW